MGAAIGDQLQSCIANHQFDAVARLLDSAELESRNPAVLEEGWPYALHLLGHIYNKNLEDARFVWKRIPINVKQNNQELQAVWRVLQYLWQRQYQGMWQALQAYSWSPQLQPFMAALAEKTRAELLELISTAYSTVKPSKVAYICGLTEQEALTACQAAGWHWNEATGTLQVVRAPAPAPPLDEQASLASLTMHMVALEQ